jgi:hypothetical protein
LEENFKYEKSDIFKFKSLFLSLLLLLLFNSKENENKKISNIDEKKVPRTDFFCDDCICPLSIKNIQIYHQKTLQLEQHKMSKKK